MQEPSTSAATSSLESSPEFLTKDDELKDNLTNALIYCKSLLETENLITDTPPSEISAASVAMGKEIFKRIMLMLEDHKIIIDEDLIHAEEIDIVANSEYEEVCLELLLIFFILFYILN